MNLVQSHLVTSVVEVADDAAYRQFFGNLATGLALLPEPVGQDGTVGLKSDYGDFLKWLTVTHPRVALTLPPSESPKVVLRSADIWLPLVCLASDTSVQIFLNMAASYLYDCSKSALKGDAPRVHLSVVYEDRQAGKTKRLNFTGNADELNKVIKKFDPNNFFSDVT